MKPTGIVLFGGRLDGREINTKRELEEANERVKADGAYAFSQRRSREGRLVFAFRHTARSAGPD